MTKKSNQKRADRKKQLRKYGLTGKDYAKMAREQENRCAICHRLSVSDVRRYLSVDHDHATGKVRGLLCHNCNAMLGFAGDNPQILTNAIEYLKENA